MVVKVKWSASVWVITIVALAILFVAEYYLIRSLVNFVDWLSLTGAIIIPIIVFYFALETPRYLDLTKSYLILYKRIGRVLIDVNQISKIESYTPSKFEIRLFGSGGVFGFIGKFRSTRIGNYQSYVGDYAQAFWIETKTGKKYVFSSEDRDVIIHTIKKQLQ